MMELSEIKFERMDTVAVLRLNRPSKMNALTNAMIADFFTVIDALEKDRTIRAAVITGEGKAFCAGGDLEELQDRYGGNTGFSRHMDIVSKMIAAFAELPIPVIAAVNGAAVGAGMNIALAADLILAGEKAKFSEIFSNIGLVPDLGGTYFLPRLVGRQKAKELIFTAKMLSAQEACELGIVNRVVAQDSLEAEALALAKRLAAGPTQAYALAKRMINQSFETDLRTALDYEGTAQALCGGSADYEEGISAFLEKRKANFTGQ